MTTSLHKAARSGTIYIRTLLAVAAVTGLLALAGPVHAQIYVTFGYLPTFSTDPDFEIGPKPAENEDFAANRAGSGSFDFGLFGLRAAAGLRLFFVRLEGEASYRQLKLSDFEYATHHDYTGASLETLIESITVESGDLKTLNPMANVYLGCT